MLQESVTPRQSLPARLGQQLFAALEWRYALFVIVALGFLVRIVALVYVAPFPLRDDAAFYHTMAVSLHRSEAFTPYFPPGVSYYLSFFYPLFGDTELAARIATLFLYPALVVLLYQLTRLLSTRAAATLVVLIFTVYPAFIWYSVEPLSQLPTAVLLLAATSLTLRMDHKEGGWPTLVALGLTLGAIVLIRPSNGLLALAIPLYLLIRLRNLRAVLLPLLVAFLLIAAWLWKAQEMTGRFVMINDANAVNFFIGNNPYTPLYKTWWFGWHAGDLVGVPAEYVALRDNIESQPPETRNALYTQTALTHIAEQPTLFILRTLNRTRAFFAFDTATGSALHEFYKAPSLLIFGAMGADALLYCLITLATILLLFRVGGVYLDPNATRIIIAITLLYGVPYWFSFAHPNYHAPIVPLLGVLAAIFVERLVSQPRQESATPTRRPVALVAALLLFAYIQIEWLVIGLGRFVTLLP